MFVSARLGARAACLHTISIIAIEPVQRDDSHSGRSCKLALHPGPTCSANLQPGRGAVRVQAPTEHPTDRTRTQHRRATTSSTPHAHHNGPHAELRGPCGISGITTRAFGPVSSIQHLDSLASLRCHPLCACRSASLHGPTMGPTCTDKHRYRNAVASRRDHMVHA